MLREFTIGVLGTARFRPWWYGQNDKEIDDRQINFNEIFWSVDSSGTSLLRWMNNILFFLVTIVHNVMDVSKRLRMMPRVNQKNKTHMEKVWGKQGKVHVYITKIVDYYYHWMCCIYLSDKNIGYYNPYIFCHRTWIPVFILLIYMIILNICIYYVSNYKRTCYHSQIFCDGYCHIFSIKLKIMIPGDKLKINRISKNRNRHLRTKKISINVEKEEAEN